MHSEIRRYDVLMCMSFFISSNNHQSERGVIRANQGKI